jgi:hypothetical protein
MGSRVDKLKVTSVLVYMTAPIATKMEKYQSRDFFLWMFTKTVRSPTKFTTDGLLVTCDLSKSPVGLSVQGRIRPELGRDTFSRRIFSTTTLFRKPHMAF